MIAIDLSNFLTTVDLNPILSTMPSIIFYLEFSPQAQAFIDNLNKTLITILIFLVITPVHPAGCLSFRRFRKNFNKRADKLDF